MATIGSVFLGDKVPRRILTMSAGRSSSSNASTSSMSPPASPPADGAGSPMSISMLAAATALAINESETEEESISSVIGRRARAGSDPTASNTPIARKAQAIQLPHPVTVDPELALELRIRWLEALLLGVKSELAAGGGHEVEGNDFGKRKEKEKEVKTVLEEGDEDERKKARQSLLDRGAGGAGVVPRNQASNAGVTAAEVVAAKKAKEKEVKAVLDVLKPGDSLTRLVEDLKKQLGAVVASNEGLKKFMEKFDQHAHFLTPVFALSGLLPDSASYQNLSPEELETLLVEMEPDIRAADRDMREIEALGTKGVTEAGKLRGYELLQPRLDALISGHKEIKTQTEALEKRITAIMRQNATHVDALSELFVEWDESLTETEDRIVKLEREKVDRVRLGLE